MNYKNEPQFIIKENLQKSNQTGISFKDLITIDVLKDVCIRLTGIDKFSHKYVDDDYEDGFLFKGYNKGRLLYFIIKE